MATLVHRKTGKNRGFEIRFSDPHGRTLTITLGRKFNQKTATDLKGVVEALIYYLDNAISVPDKRVLTWIETASQEIKEKLAKAGLIAIPKNHTVTELWDLFLKQKAGIKESTEKTYTDAKRRFFEFFQESELLSSLTQVRMKQWKEFLKGTLAESTIAGTITKVKAVFNWAVESGMIEKSPLDGVGRGSFVNREKDRFITMEEYRRLLDASPCQDWRVIIALARYGGLRAPSEVLRLRWSDINWEKSRFYVSSSKTERYEGKEGRVVPLFEELREELEKLFFAQPEKTEFVITRYRDPERSNLGTQFARIVKMAGVEPIQRPFDNMRASRSTEIYAEYGAFLESKWIGHSSKIAKDHYLQVREEDFERATGKKFKAGRANCSESNFPPLKRRFPTSEKNFPTTLPTSTERNQAARNGKQEKQKCRKPLDLRHFAITCD